mgnify:FL=1
MSRSLIERLEGKGEEHLTVYGEGVPASIAYLHSLVARGMADYYNYSDGVTHAAVLIRIADRDREPALRNVRSVTLRYKSEEQ